MIYLDDNRKRLNPDQRCAMCFRDHRRAGFTLTVVAAHLFGGWFLGLAAMIADFELAFVSGSQGDLSDVLGVFHAHTGLGLVIFQTRFGDVDFEVFNGDGLGFGLGQGGAREREGEDES